MSEAEADDSGDRPGGRSAVASTSKSETGEEPDIARLEALLAAAEEGQARDRERSEGQPVRSSLSLNKAADRQEARERSEELLRDAELAAPDGFDPVKMWEAIKEAFRIADLRAKVATVPSKADVEAAVTVRKAAQALADASAKMFERNPVVGLIIARRLRHLGKTERPASAAAAFDLLLRCPASALALAEAAKQAATEMDAARQAGAAWPYAPGEPAAAWLFTEGLPGVFTRFFPGEKATFTVDSATTRSSACVRFIQAAHVATGRGRPSAAAIVQTAQRAQKATTK